jgi:hypothetical protein
VNQTINRASAALLEFVHDRFDKQLGESGATLVSSNGRDHEVSIQWVWAAPFVSQKFVRSDGNDLVVAFEHENFPMQFSVRRTIPPRQQARNNFGDFLQPLVIGRANIEMVKLTVGATGVRNHPSIEPTDRTVPDGRQIGPPGFAGGGVRRPPFARLRRGRFDGSLRTAMMRWIVDQRASSRPFSMRDKSACVTPQSSANSCWLHPSA